MDKIEQLTEAVLGLIVLLIAVGGFITAFALVYNLF